MQDRDDVRQEVAIMDHLSGHANVVTLVNAFEDQKNVHIVMELCTGGELFDRIVSRGHYSERTAAQIIRAIVEVVAHCHSMGVVHRDLKPENFLLSSTGNASELKAIDFGLSSFFQPNEFLSDIVGSAYYVAPEVLKKHYSYQCDIWSCGVILYILLCGIPPFYAESETAIFRAVIKGTIDFESHPWPSISTEAKDCVRKMLTRDIHKRATAQQILKVLPVPGLDRHALGQAAAQHCRLVLIHLLNIVYIFNGLSTVTCVASLDDRYRCCQ